MKDMAQRWIAHHAKRKSLTYVFFNSTKTAHVIICCAFVLKFHLSLTKIIQQSPKHYLTKLCHCSYKMLVHCQTLQTNTPLNSQLTLLSLFIPKFKLSFEDGESI